MLEAIIKTRQDLANVSGVAVAPTLGQAETYPERLD